MVDIPIIRAEGQPQWLLVNDVVVPVARIKSVRVSVGYAAIFELTGGETLSAEGDLDWLLFGSLTAAVDQANEVWGQNAADADRAASTPTDAAVPGGEA